MAASTKRPGPAGFGKAKSCFIIFLKGGPSQQETFDTKPDAPAQIRGEFRPIASRVPGIFLGEHIPRLARNADKFTVVRSVTHRDNNHASAAYEMTTGHVYPRAANLSGVSTRDDHPHVGSSVSEIESKLQPVPPFVMVPQYLVVNGEFRSGQNAGFLGPRFDPLVPGGDPSRPDFRPIDLGLVLPVEPARLQDRRALLAALDARSRRFDAAVAERTLADHYQKAFALLETGLTRQAFDIQAEAPAVRDRYGRNFFGQSLLVGRRLVEAGVRLVQVNCMSSIFGGTVNWDTHKDNFELLKNVLLPRMDLGVAALLEDLSARGLLDETLVVMMGEFGRTPKINDHAGRDHWAQAFSVLLAGAGIPGGHVYGATDRSGSYPADRPVKSGQLAATIFHALGIDPAAQIPTLGGRPWQIAEQAPVEALWN